MKGILGSLATTRASLERWLDGQGITLPLRVTLLALLLAPIGSPTQRPLILAMALAGLLAEPLLLRVGYWLTLLGLTSWRVIADWPLADNHSYLWIYWCLAIALALGTRAPAPTLARSARLLIGLVFFFAALWKGVLSEDFVDGRFFRVLFATDARFEDLALFFGGISEASLEQLRTLLERNVHQPVRMIPSTIETEAMRSLALFATWTSLAFESLIALFFLLPRRPHLEWVGDLLLMVFCATTYVLAPVPGFGWLLLSLGLAQTPPQASSLRGLYLATFALVIFHDHIPWLEVLAGG